MERYASGKRAWGICDRCGWRCRLNEMRAEYVQGMTRGNKVCPACYDEDHPQNFSGRMGAIVDPEALADPRPDTGRTASTSFSGFGSSLNPAGNPSTYVSVSCGTVTVETD
jgi:hypothetical protein